MLARARAAPAAGRALLHTYSDATQSLFPSVAKFNVRLPTRLPAEIVAERGEGCHVWDTSGRRYLDFASGIGVLSTGHSHPRVAAAIADQARRLLFAQQNILPVTPPMVALLERLKRIVPPSLNRFFFTQSGSEAVDNAVKLARAATGRQNVVCFQGGYHGRTYGAMSLTTSKNVYRQGFGPLPSGVVAAPYPYCLHCKARAAAGGLGHGTCEVPGEAPGMGGPYGERRCCGGPLEDLATLFKTQSHPGDTAAVIVEPIMGEGGFLVPPPGFLAALRVACSDIGAVLIFDEVQAGVGRTGAWWSHQLLTDGDVQPDVMIFAKGIASGFPFAGLAARAGLFDGSFGGGRLLEPGTMGGTYGGSTLGCAAAAATIDVIEEEGLLANAAARGRQLAAGLAALAQGGLPIAEVRGRGLMVAAELGPEIPPGTAARAVKTAAERGVLLLTCGARETLRFLPPLVVDEAQVEEALAAFEAALRDSL